MSFASTGSSIQLIGTNAKCHSIGTRWVWIAACALDSTIQDAGAASPSPQTMHGGTSCAERTALFKAVSEGVTRFTDIAVVGSRRGEVNKQITSPCGVCRQALFEFGGPELNVIMARSPEDFIERSMDELLPFGFGPSNVAGNKAVKD